MQWHIPHAVSCQTGFLLRLIAEAVLLVEYAALADLLPLHRLPTVSQTGLRARSPRPWDIKFLDNLQSEMLVCSAMAALGQGRADVGIVHHRGNVFGRPNTGGNSW